MLAHLKTQKDQEKHHDGILFDTLPFTVSRYGSFPSKFFDLILPMIIHQFKKKKKFSLKFIWAIVVSNNLFVREDITKKSSLLNVYFRALPEGGGMQCLFCCDVFLYVFQPQSSEFSDYISKRCTNTKTHWPVIHSWHHVDEGPDANSFNL